MQQQYALFMLAARIVERVRWRISASVPCRLLANPRTSPKSRVSAWSRGKKARYPAGALIQCSLEEVSLFRQTALSWNEARAGKRSVAVKADAETLGPSAVQNPRPPLLQSQKFTNGCATKPKTPHCLRKYHESPLQRALAALFISWHS